MQWSAQQERALSEVAAWIRTGDEPVFRMFGYAGSGKSTLAKHLAEGTGKRVLFGAFTGKAASVLRDKGCVGAMTIHQMIYQVSSKCTQKLRTVENNLLSAQNEEAPEDEIRRLQRVVDAERKRVKQPAFTVNRDAPARDADLIIIDECSMVNEYMGADLLSFDVPILVLGDPAQLPPVRGCGFFTQHKPNIMLDEIHRQARDNPIIDLATRVRQNKRLEYGEYGASKVVERATPEDAQEADQILVGLNKTRKKCIQRFRALGGFEGPIPQPGERVVCLRNDHEEGLLNGTIWKVHHVVAVDGHDQITMTISPEGHDARHEVVAHRHHFEGRGEELSQWTRRDAQEFDFGCALTVHKAQGSQWGSVLVFDESHAFNASRNKWLYTAITRASEKVVVVRK